MNKTRLEAFSDAVIAIIMTIMVLELKVPHGTDLEALSPLLPVFLSYVLSIRNRHFVAPFFCEAIRIDTSLEIPEKGKR